jgi:hypothetical protein
MNPAPVGATIRISTRAALDLRPGQAVTVQVLKPLADGKWAVGLSGRVFPALSAVPLETGQRLDAVVERAGRQILLRLSGQATLQAAVSVPAARFAETAATALLSEGLPADEALVRRIAARLRTLAGPERKNARTLAIAEARGIDPDSPGIDALLALLHFEENPDRGRYRRRQLPPGEDDQASAVKAELAREPADDALGLFNALRPADRGAGHWIAIPFSFRYEGRDLCGTARFLYQGPFPRPLRVALDVRGRRQWGFALSGRPGARRLEVFADGAEARRRARDALTELRAKLQNHGVEVDDSINDTNAFDGYTAAVGSGRVDLVG